MLNFLKKWFGSTEEVEVNDDGFVVQEVADGEDALMQNAILAMKTGKVVFGDYEDGVLISRIHQKDND